MGLCLPPVHFYSQKTARKRVLIKKCFHNTLFSCRLVPTKMGCFLIWLFLGKKLYEKLFADRKFRVKKKTLMLSISNFYALQLLFHTYFDQTSFSGRFVAAKMCRFLIWIFFGRKVIRKIVYWPKFECCNMGPDTFYIKFLCSTTFVSYIFWSDFDFWPFRGCKDASFFNMDLFSAKSYSKNCLLTEIWVL